MIKTRAYIRLFEDGRKTPFANGYRPLFNFVDDVKTSGSITLVSKDEFCPGEEGEVEIVFLTKEYLGAEFKKGSTFSFGEGGPPLGEGEILSIEEIKSLC